MGVDSVIHVYELFMYKYKNKRTDNQLMNKEVINYLTCDCLYAKLDKTIFSLSLSLLSILETIQISFGIWSKLL